MAAASLCSDPSPLRELDMARYAQLRAQTAESMWGMQPHVPEALTLSKVVFRGDLLGSSEN